MDGSTYKVKFHLPDSLRIGKGLRALAVLEKALGRTDILNFKTHQGIYYLTDYTLGETSSSSSAPRPDSDGDIWVWQANNSEPIATLFVIDLFSWPQA